MANWRMNKSVGRKTKRNWKNKTPRARPMPPRPFRNVSKPITVPHTCRRRDSGKTSGQTQTTRTTEKGETPPPPETVYRVTLQINPPSEKEMERLHQQASTFILVTNVMDKTELPDTDILKSYKGQQTVENRFRFLKSPYFVGRIFLEKPKRVEAFAYVMMLSVMVYSLFEYLIRKNMEQEQEPLDLLGGNRKSFRPTGESVLEILDDVNIAVMEQNGQMIRLYPENNRPQVKKILDLLELNMDIYTQPRHEKAVETSSQ
jgi:hypothetical protein